MDRILTATYLVVWLVLAVGTTIFLKRQTPLQKKHWQPRLSLLAVAVVGGFMIAFCISSGQVLAGCVAFVLVAGMAYLGLTRGRMCGQCGTGAWAGFGSAPTYCSRCGAPLTPNNVFGRDW